MDCKAAGITSMLLSTAMQQNEINRSNMGLNDQCHIILENV
jgi:hypothetical protein